MENQKFSNVQKITSAENLRLRASDEKVSFREFIICQVFGNLAKQKQQQKIAEVIF
jgi:hypothetical protein|uniref:hypothetical protein n=1 Tax=Alloprevotella sp. TaxID=1872471 RepID=UPI0040285714